MVLSFIRRDYAGFKELVRVKTKRYKIIILRLTCTIQMSLKYKQTAGAFHLEKISRNFGWELNGKQFFDSSHRKIPGKSRTSKKVSPFFRLECSERIFVFHYHVSRISYQFQDHGNKICHGHFGKKWPLSQWISVQFVFSVLTP